MIQYLYRCIVINKSLHASKKIVPVITYDVEVNEVGHVWRRRDLTFVHARIPMLGIFDLEAPVLRARLVDSSEPLVRRVGVPADRQKVDVSMPHPRDLKQ